MKRSTAVIGAALLVASATVSGAEVNCKQVRKYLETGRSVEDVATTMVISESDVKKCQEQGGEAKPGEKKPMEGSKPEGAK